MKKTRQNLKSFTGVGVTYRQHEEAEAKGQHEDIQHQVLLVLLSCRACFFAPRLRVAGKSDGVGSTRDRRCNPGFARSSGREVPLAAYVFEAGVPAIL